MKVITFLLPALLFSNYCLAYTAKSSHEAKLTFDHWVIIPDGAKSPSAALNAVKDQLTYMYGPLSLGRVLAAPKGDEDFAKIASTIKIEKQDDGSYIASYRYNGTIVVKDTSVDKFVMPLPNDPSTIFQTSVDNVGKGKKNPCTDDDYQSAGDFWYFWSPNRPGCKGHVLTETKDYTYVSNLKLNLIPNVESSYPEYENLPDKNGQIEITLIMGKDESTDIKSPRRRTGEADDLNAKNFRKVEALLKKLGKDDDLEFTSHEWTVEETKAVVKEPLRPYPFVEEFDYKYTGAKAKASSLKVRVVYTTIDIDHQSNGFHYFIKDSVNRSAVTIYDGHSGLGGNISLSAIREAVNTDINFRLPKERYQIFFFNSCTSYAYYNDVFFKRKLVEGSSDKKGSKYLDILTTGLETAFDGSVETDMELINVIHEWAETGARKSYQQLAHKMESQNLFGVNGDEDNPTR